ncbi:MAG: ERCC4 domain-containing protein, partial [Prevotella sp.]|nr:ERCC4 domain-containing protein [Prevotella sp.]
MEILIDAREQGEKYSLGTRKDRAQKHYNELGYPTHIERLDYGDYLFNNETVFEYKTITDLMSSIRDKSVFEEVANQTKHYPYSYLIIVGDINHYIQYMFDIPRIYNHWDGDY